MRVGLGSLQRDWVLQFRLIGNLGRPWGLASMACFLGKFFVFFLLGYGNFYVFLCVSFNVIDSVGSSGVLDYEADFVFSSSYFFLFL